MRFDSFKGDKYIFYQECFYEFDTNVYICVFILHVARVSIMEIVEI